MMGVGAKRAIGLYRSCAPRHVFGGNLLIGFACFDSVEPGEGVSDIAQECAVDGFRGVAQNELGLDAASTQAERCVDAECILANGAIRSRLATMNNREKQGIWAIFVPDRPFFDVATLYISDG